MLQLFTAVTRSARQSYSIHGGVVLLAAARDNMNHYVTVLLPSCILLHAQ